ncbi:class I SAM-dependent methyltransferase [Brevibacterium atlanticum]|uniref:class I SAM-dependent methyltransferase n=1 Tax=Brevibacterium atlanticum TaxID=2697563 RepID=UPI00141FC709|nr:class I SAM-dependent methyltransferase [Brevibacterium atlanticum]
MTDGTNATADPDSPGRSAREAPTRESYDAIATMYTDWIADELTAKPHDRAVLGAYSELVLATGSSDVLDIGCGPGRITSFLAALGLTPSGLDLSPAMIELARGLYPSLDFAVGTMTALPYADDTFSGLVAWYSIIHIPDEELSTAFAEAARVLRPGGWFQLAFQLGDRVDHFSDLAGFDVDLDFHRRSIDEVLTALEPHGFTPATRLEREPDRSGRYPEATRQGYLLVRRTER